MRQKNASSRTIASQKPHRQVLACVLFLAGILLLTACTLEDAPTSNSTAIPNIPTDLAAGIVPAGTLSIPLSPHRNVKSGGTQS
jgi:hypothetical protein